MTFRTALARIMSATIRHRVDIQTGVYLTAVFIAACLMIWEFDIFSAASEQSDKTKTVELDEVLVLAAILGGGFTIFLGHHLRQKREMRRRVEAEREVRRLALEDPLTGLPNRRQFDDALKTLLQSPPRAGGSHGILMLDLNGFKRVNDVHGHPVGDQVLTHVAARLRGAARSGDLVARLGGDEFAILAPHLVGPDAATAVALRITEALTDPISTGSGQSHVIGTAIGIALVPQDGLDQADVLRKADIALYRAKGQGRFATRFFETEMDASIRERETLETLLRSAIASGGLSPFYQPQVNLETGAIVGFEALARWTHPELGEIEPNRFIPIAEDCGLLGDLTERLLRQACRDAREWPSHVSLSFNISPAQLRDQTLGLRILGVLGEVGFPANRLVLEITESALVRDMEAAQKILGALRASGIRIALDDFGTGYSSLYHLRNFKLDEIKIDRSFVESMVHDPESAAIVKALVGLGSGLSLAVTAEGVETEEQQAMLAANGCRLAQGYRFSRAVPADEALAMFTAPAAQRA